MQTTESGDRSRVNALIDWDGIIEKAVADFGPAEAESWHARAGLRRSIDKDTGVAAQWISMRRQGWRFKLLRITNSGRAALLFRAAPPFSGEGGIAYYKLFLQHGPDGSSRAGDIYAFGVGELLSETLRRVLLPLAADLSRDFLDKLIGDHSCFASVQMG